jgi:phosphoketolase
MKTSTLTPELHHKMDAYWRAANYLSVGQIYLYARRCSEPVVIACRA